MTVYQDAEESTAHEHPVEADGNGRWPAVFIPFVASYDEKVTTSGGTQLTYYTDIPNPDPVEASEDSVEDEELISTGDVIFRFVNTTKTGFVRANGRTMGNAASGGTERANADTADLFTHLYNSLADTQAPVSGGRGANAAADYAANKTITLPDARGAMLLGLDDMGNSASSKLGSVTFGHGNATTAGSLAGGPSALNTQTIAEANLAAHTHSDGTYASASNGAHTHGPDNTGDASASHTHAYNEPGGNTEVQAGTGATVAGPRSSQSTGANSATHQHSHTASSSGAHTHDVTGASGLTGSGTAFNIVSRSLLGTWFIKL